MTGERLVLTEPDDAGHAAAALAEGWIVGHGFANLYALTARPDAATVRAANVMRGLPPERPGSVTTTPQRMPLLIDWARLPAGLRRGDVLALMEALLLSGPFGFRAPASSKVPGHLTRDGTMLLISPGLRCPSIGFLARALDATGADLLFTSSRTSRGATPPHHRGDALRAEFAGERRFLLLEHANEDAARLRYSGYTPTAPSIVALHRLTGDRLVLERHGGLHADEVRTIAARFGFELDASPERLPQRDYESGVESLPTSKCRS